MEGSPRNNLEELVKIALREEAANRPTPKAEVPQLSTMETTLLQITEQFAKTLTGITQQFLKGSNTKPSAPLRNTYSGDEQEDPIWFFRNLETYMERTGVEEEAEKIICVENQLRGEAKRWSEPYRNLRESYDRYKQRLLQHFNSNQRVAHATTTLYGTSQRKEESVAAFITKKQMLFQRLAIDTEDEFRTDILLNQLTPEIRSRIRGRTFYDVEEFLNIAIQIEEDLKETKREVRPLGTTSRPPARVYQSPPANNSRNPQDGANTDTRRPPTPCKYCSAWHYHAACPKNLF